jgi:2-C-methyl-D-erythritol 4-phosphate cytidylyltransferase
MIEGSRVGVIIPAAGRGVRMGGSRRKQFIELEGRAILYRTLDLFESSPDIDLIVLAVDPDDTETTPAVIREAGIVKCTQVIPGGEERQDSVRNALAAFESNPVDLVVVHDAVRPFCSPDLLHNVISKALLTGAAIAAVRPKETIKRSADGETIIETLPRGELWVAQTPQVFDQEILRSAYESGAGIKATDDAGLVERLGVKVSVVEGEYENIKITTPEDLLLAEAIMRRRSPGAVHH